MSGVVRVLLADDHALVRAGIRSLIESIEGMTVVGEAGNGREALALAAELRPNLVMMDITMKELNGIDATAELLQALPEVRVLVLSMHAGPEFVTRALKAGAHGYLVKDSAPLELRMAVEAIMRGQVYLSPRVSRHVVAGLHQPAGQAGSVLDSLSPRQRGILQLIAEGKSTKEIAYLLEVSVKTVETHRAAIMDRLGIRDVAGLVVFAIRNGLIDLEAGDS